MLNFPPEPNRRNTAFNQFSTTFRRIFNPIFLNGRKNKTKENLSSSNSKSTTATTNNKLIDDCKNSKVYPVSSDHPIEINLNVPNNSPQEQQKQVIKECQICFIALTDTNSKSLECGHTSCDSCLIKYLKTEISESRVSITCPECQILLHPNRIQELLVDDPHCLAKYEEFIIRKVLVTDPDTRFCPAPDCNYAVIASNCSKCPILRCGRDECKTLFCFNCKKKCSEHHKCKKSKTKSTRKLNKKSSKNSQKNSTNDPSTSTTTDSSDEGDVMDTANLSTSEFFNRFNMKPCPACSILIIKIEDGSCNHMTCSVCGCQFCWLCIKKTSELHYLSPSGCTFFGKRQWSRKKKLFWQLGLLLGAPVFITLSAAIALPSIIIGVPVYFGKKLQAKLSTKKLGKFKKAFFVTTGVISSAIISPILAAGVISIGVPFLLAYVYGIVPITLCRSKTQLNDQKNPTMKMSDEEARAFLKQLSGKENKEKLANKIKASNATTTTSKKSNSNKKGVTPKDKDLSTSKSSRDKYKLLTRTALHNSIESIQSTKGPSDKFFVDDHYELTFFVDDDSSSDEASSSSKGFSSSSNLELEFKNKKKNFKNRKDELKVVQANVHCDQFGKKPLKKSNKKLEVKSLENLADITFCEICDTSHVKKIIHRPCCPNFN